MDPSALPRALVSHLAGLVASWRHAPALHPRGTVHACTLTVLGGPSAPQGAAGTPGWGARLLDRPARHEGVVRLSRSAGLPRPLPDVDGMAVRLPGAGLDGQDLDLLLVSAWRFVFVPTGLSRTWSCILPFRTGTGRLVLLGARPRRDGFELFTAAPLGRWRRWAHLAVGERVGERLATAPTVGADDLRHVQAFRRLRAQAYVASQAAWGGSRRRLTAG